MTKDEALKQALEALQAHGAAYLHHELRYKEAITAIKEALAQPAQEPVAWAVYDKRGGSKSLHWPENHSPNGDATMFDAVPLVPQRPWVGLTDDEIEAERKEFDRLKKKFETACAAIRARGNT